METLSNRSNYAPHFDGSITGLKASMKNAGIDYSVIANIATNPAQNIAVNNWAIESNCGNIVSFGSIHPEFAGYKAELKRLKEAGIKGIKFHSDYQEFFIDEKRMFSIYEEIAKHGFVILFHCGEDLGLRDQNRCTPMRLKNLIDSFGYKKIVGAHLGGYGYWNDMKEHIIGRDIFLDTSFGLTLMDEELRDYVIKNHSAEKLMFATDTPWQGQAAELKQYYGFGLNPVNLDKMLGGNAKKLLQLN
jgi:predicted TIM-barrel fold metal-dependent hydrolase